MAEINKKATVFDVAAYILEKKGEMSAWRLQKLVYYSQAWSLVWDERPLFDEPIQAWANGPVCLALSGIPTDAAIINGVLIRVTVNLGIVARDRFGAQLLSEQVVNSGKDFVHAQASRTRDDGRNEEDTGRASGRAASGEVQKAGS
jgi:hypothetical protein